MRLESVSIRHFRSIESGELTNCGGFNVLIGKNNAGKSNILSALHTFFVCIVDSNIVNLDPPIGREVDLFGRDSRLPIEITHTFSLSLAERDALIRDIVTEAPQLRNAVDGIDPSLRLAATITITPPPSHFAYVSKLALVSGTKHGTKGTVDRMILSISDEAALELYNLAARARRLSKDAEILSAIDGDDLRIFLGTRVTGARQERREIVPAEYLLRRFRGSDISNELMRSLESTVGESTSAEEILRGARALASSRREEAQAIQEETLRNKILTFSGEETAVPNYIRNLLRAISEIKVLRLAERRKVIGKEEAEQLLSLKVSRGGERVLSQIKQSVSDLLGVQIDAFQSGETQGRSERTAELDVDNFLVEVNGSGIREALRVILDVEFRKPQILLVEEPEIHLHPALETSMMRFLKHISADCQVFITTHSTNFLDTTEMKNVYLVSKPDSTKIQQLDFEEAEAQIPKELGIRLSSLFMFDRLVFVEGDSDEAVLREWASTLEINLSQPNVGFVAMGGVRNFTHYATEATLSFLAKRQVKMWFLIDRDERDELEIAKLQAGLGEKAVVEVLEKREIENYLICPRAIVELIKSKKTGAFGKGNNDDLPTESEIQDVINESAEKLKQMTIDKQVARVLCNPVYPNRNRIFREIPTTTVIGEMTEEVERMITQLTELRNTADSVYKEKSGFIESIWETRRLDLVPGDLLLDMVCRHHGVRFRKERDSAHLASIMNADEIDQEIKNIIDRIGSS